MATEVNRTYVGQYQYHESESIMTDVSSNYKTMQINNAFDVGTSNRDGETGGLEDSMTFTDVSIKKTSGNLSSELDYYVRVEIPEDNCYDNNFLIKLINDNYNASSQDYQFIMNYSIPKSASEDSLYTAALYLDPGIISKEQKYPDPSGDGVRYNRVIGLEGSDKDHPDFNQLYLIKVWESGVVNYVPSFLPYDTEGEPSPIKNPTVGNVYFTKDENGELKLWICTSTTANGNRGSFNQISKTQYSVFTMYASWDKDQTEGVGVRVVEFLFRPATNDFNQILFELVRGVQDYGIINSETTLSGKQTVNYGRTTSIKSFKIYEMKNLIASMDAQKPVNRIGIWGHPEQIMGINGEQILIGPSGYYELSNYKITSLSVVARDFKTGAFTLDYTWQDSSDQKER